MICFWPNGWIQRIDACETFIDNRQTVTHQTCIKWNFPCNYKMLVIAKTLTTVKFVGRASNRWETKYGLNVEHTCKLLNTCNIINTHHWNKPAENWYGLKYHQLNKLSKKGTITKSYKRASWQGHSTKNNKHTIIEFSQLSCFSLNTKYYWRGFLDWRRFPAITQMEYTKRSYNLQTEDLNEFIEPNGYTTTSSLSEIHIYIHISIRKPIQETVR